MQRLATKDEGLLAPSLDAGRILKTQTLFRTRFLHDLAATARSDLPHAYCTVCVAGQASPAIKEATYGQYGALMGSGILLLAALLLLVSACLADGDPANSASMKSLEPPKKQRDEDLLILEAAAKGSIEKVQQAIYAVLASPRSGFKIIF